MIERRILRSRYRTHIWKPLPEYLAYITYNPVLNHALTRKSKTYFDTSNLKPRHEFCNLPLSHWRSREARPGQAGAGGELAALLVSGWDCEGGGKGRDGMGWDRTAAGLILMEEGRERLGWVGSDVSELWCLGLRV